MMSTPSIPHSATFRGGTSQIKSTPSIHHSATFVEVSHHVYAILSSLRNLSWRFVSNQVYTIYSSLHNFRGGTSQIKSTPSIPHSTTFVEVRVKSSLHHPVLTPQLSWRYVSSQVCIIQSSLHNLRGSRCQIKSTPSFPHSTAFVKVSVTHHPFLTPPREGVR